jgi:hypothetical protein
VKPLPFWPPPPPPIASTEISASKSAGTDHDPVEVRKTVTVAIRAAYQVLGCVSVPLVTCTVCPEVTDVLEMMMSVPDVPTVRPLTITVPALSLNSAFAAVPVADAVVESGTPEIVSTSPDTVAGVVESVIVARTPVAPERADVPITSDPAETPVVSIVGVPAEPRAFTIIFMRRVLSALL